MWPFAKKKSAKAESEIAADLKTSGEAERLRIEVFSAKIEAEREANRAKWVGANVVVSLTKKIAAQPFSISNEIPMSARYRAIPTYPNKCIAFITEAVTFSAKVTDVGLNVIKLNEDWYELDELKPGGVRIIEVL